MLEFYGFALYIGTFVSTLIILVWAFVPEKILWYLGITYFPSKYWAGAIPALLIVTYTYIFIAYNFLLLFLCRPSHALASCKDSFLKLSCKEEQDIPALADIPQNQISERIALIDDIFD